jgi:hypothetical protein
MTIGRQAQAFLLLEANPDDPIASLIARLLLFDNSLVWC